MIGIRAEGDNMSEEKEMLEGYCIDSHIWVGNTRICFGISEDKNEKYPYMVCEYESKGFLFPVCDKMSCFDDFSEAVSAYAEKIGGKARELEQKRKEIGLDDVSCLTPNDLVSVSYDMSIRNKVVAVSEQSISHGYRDIAHQLYYVDGGFGVEANSRGRACYGWSLYTGEKCRIERPDVIGIVPEEKMPDFAKNTLERILKEQKRKREERDAR